MGGFRPPALLEDDEEITRLYAWVIQVAEDGTSAVCAAFQEAGGFPSRVRWNTRSDAVHEGVFRPGQAYAMALSVRKVGREGSEPSAVWSVLGEPVDQSTRWYWWSETIILKKSKEGSTA